MDAARPGRSGIEMDDRGGAGPYFSDSVGEYRVGHLFISHSSRDGGAIAQALAGALEEAGQRCWIAPRDVRPGVPYPGQIVAAIEASAGLVLIVTAAANESPDVLQELQLAATARKVIAPVIASAAPPSPDIRYYIGVRHQIPWNDARSAAGELLRSFPVSGGQPAPASDAASEDLVDLFMISHGENKISAIKVVREFTGLGLADAKTLVEGFPPVRVAHAMPRSRATAFARELIAVGANLLDPSKTIR
jgi:ribosomal protein L7/L12